MEIIDSTLKKVEPKDISDGFFNIPSEVTIIGNNAFDGCNNLINIILPENLIQINEGAFNNCNNIERIITPWGISNIKTNDTKEICTHYLYLLANSILKEKYTSIDEFLSNPYISDLVNHELLLTEPKIIEKFKHIFYKLRQKYDINPELLFKLSQKSTEKFNLDSWNKIKKIVYFNKSYEENYEVAEIISQIIEIFGLFERDPNKKERIEKLKEIINNNPYRVRKDELDKQLLDTYFNKINTVYFILKEEIIIPNEFKLYLTNPLSEEKRKIIKHLTGNYGKRINEFIKENYKRVNWVSYEIKEEYLNDKSLKNKLFVFDIEGKVTYKSLVRIFSRCQKEFNKDFYNFFIDNLPFILSDKNLQLNIKNIQLNFEEIKKHYYDNSGVEKITLKQAVDYIENKLFSYKDGNYELALDVKKAGVNEQAAFDFYQDIYEQNNIRKKRSLIRRSNIYQIDKYTIKTELLRKDDSFSMLVGETNYTNCCQVFGGVGHNCLAHATSSHDGGIFVTKLLKDGKEILLTQSWDWQNNNVYCHDNIEVTQYLKNNPQLKKIVAKAFELDANYLINKSEEEIKKYIKTRKKIIEKSLSNEKEKLLDEIKELENREVIKLVTVGIANDKFGISNYFKQSIDVMKNQIINNKLYKLKNFQPVNYNNSQPYFNKERPDYNDSYITQDIIAGNIENLYLDKDELLIPIYRDERRIIKEDKNIKNHTAKKIKDIEKKVYPHKMTKYQQYTEKDFEKYNIYLGEDWYLIYEEKENNVLCIHDLARINPNLNDEKQIQFQEIQHVIYNLIKEHDIVEANLRENNSYLLFLINKELGYIEQIGEDIAYEFDKPNNKTITTKEKQQEILNNIKKIRNNDKSKQIFHKLYFRKTNLLLNKNQKVLKKTNN